MVYNKNTKTKNRPTSISNLKLKSQIKSLSWNIQSSKTGLINKFEDLSFTNIFSGHDIICLQEIRQAVKLPGFRSLCNLRPGERHGGVAILYKNELMGGIELVNNHKLNDLVICKLKKSFFKLNQDIYIINAYITPFNTSASKFIIDGRESLKNIENIVLPKKFEGF